MSEKRIRVGIVGANVNYGWGTRGHIPAFMALPEYELVAVATQHLETAQETAQRYRIELAFADYHEMVRHPEVDMVSVAVKVPDHYAIVMAALGAGKHVFCEWPLGANTQEAQEMATLAKRRGVVNMVALQSRCAPHLLRLKDLVEDGYIGELVACHVSMFLSGVTRRESRRAWGADRSKGAHALSISAGHALDAFCYCVGEFSEASAVVSTQVKQWRLADTGGTVDVTSPDNVLVSGVLTNGAVASAHIASVPYHGRGFRMEVYGTGGTLIASSREMVEMAADMRLEGARGSDRALAELPISDHLVWVPPEVPKGPPFNMAQMFRRMARGIQEGQQVEPSFALAVRRHRFLDMLERASETGRRRKLK